MSSTPWSSKELATVRDLYPGATWAEILKALPDRSEKAIARKAQDLGIIRYRQMIDVKPKGELEQARIARATAKRSAKRAEIARQHVGAAAKMAKPRVKAGMSGAEARASQLRMLATQQKPCPPGTYRASNGVTLALPGQAHLYNGRRNG